MTMNKILLTAGVVLMSFLAVQAQETEMEKNKEMTGQEMIEGDDIEIITFSELPDDVKTSFETGEYDEAQVNEAYTIEGSALTELINQEAMEIYAGDLPPEKLYVLQITENNEPRAIVYYREDGEVYAEQEFGS